MYPQLEYYYRNREKILKKKREIAIKNQELNEKWGVAFKAIGGGRPITENPLKLIEDYDKIKRKEIIVFKVKKGNYSIDFS